MKRIAGKATREKALLALVVSVACGPMLAIGAEPLKLPEGKPLMIGGALHTGGVAWTPDGRGLLVGVHLVGVQRVALPDGKRQTFIKDKPTERTEFNLAVPHVPATGAIVGVRVYGARHQTVSLHFLSAPLDGSKPVKLFARPAAGTVLQDVRQAGGGLVALLHKFGRKEHALLTLDGPAFDAASAKTLATIPGEWGVAALSADWKMVAVRSRSMWQRADPMRLYRLPAAYLGSLKAIPGDVMKNATICSTTFSPDGRFLAVGYIHDKQARVGVIPLADMGKFVSLFRSRKYMAYGWLAWSPDSRHIAFVADVDKFPHPKTNNIAVVALPKELLDAHAGWSPDSLPAKKDPSRK